MRLEIRHRGVDVTEELRDYLEGRLRQALGRLGHAIDSIRVFLRDVNGPRGGLGMRCGIVVGLRRGGGVVVTGTGTEVTGAIAAAVGRAGPAAERLLKRRLARRRPPRGPARPVPPGPSAKGTAPSYFASVGR